MSLPYFNFAQADKVGVTIYSLSGDESCGNVDCMDLGVFDQPLTRIRYLQVVRYSTTSYKCFHLRTSD